MENRYTIYREYLAFLHRIGRRLGYKMNDGKTSEALTLNEHSKLAALYLKELKCHEFYDLLQQYNMIWDFAYNAVSHFCIEENPIEVIDHARLLFINCCYPQIADDLQNFKEPDNAA